MQGLSQLRNKDLRVRLYLAAALLCALVTACSRPAEPWRLTDVSGHLPDLAFSLVDDSGRAVSGQSFEGRAALVYFGYTHCPDVCPETIARLMQVLQQIGADANRAQIVFITVDPARDTPAALHSYVRAFDARHAVGLTGSDRAIESLAKRYRVAYQAEKRDAERHVRSHAQFGGLYLRRARPRAPARHRQRFRRRHRARSATRHRFDPSHDAGDRLLARTVGAVTDRRGGRADRGGSVCTRRAARKSVVRTSGRVLARSRGNLCCVAHAARLLLRA